MPKFSFASFAVSVLPIRQESSFAEGVYPPKGGIYPSVAKLISAFAEASIFAPLGKTKNQTI